MCRASKFSSDMTMITYFDIIINIIIVTNRNLVKFVKYSLPSLVITSSLLKRFSYHFTAILTFFDHTINEIVNTIFM